MKRFAGSEKRLVWLSVVPRNRLVLALLTFVFLSAPGFSAWAEPTKRVIVGTLDCTIGPSIGLVIGARQHARCFYKASQAADSTSYIGRLERVGKAAGLPSGGKLIWTVFAPDGSNQELSGRYGALSDKSQFSESDPYTVCQSTTQAICLRPLRTDGDAEWKPNFASTISAFRLETSPARSRSHRTNKR